MRDEVLERVTDVVHNGAIDDMKALLRTLASWEEQSAADFRARARAAARQLLVDALRRAAPASKEEEFGLHPSLLPARSSPDAEPFVQTVAKHVAKAAGAEAGRAMRAAITSGAASAVSHPRDAAEPEEASAIRLLELMATAVVRRVPAIVRAWVCQAQSLAPSVWNELEAVKAAALEEPAVLHPSDSDPRTVWRLVLREVPMTRLHIVAAHLAQDCISFQQMAAVLASNATGLLRPPACGFDGKTTLKGFGPITLPAGIQTPRQLVGLWLERVQAVVGDSAVTKGSVAALSVAVDIWFNDRDPRPCLAKLSPAFVNRDEEQTQMLQCLWRNREVGSERPFVPVFGQPYGCGKSTIGKHVARVLGPLTAEYVRVEVSVLAAGQSCARAVAGAVLDVMVAVLKGRVGPLQGGVSWSLSEPRTYLLHMSQLLGMPIMLHADEFTVPTAATDGAWPQRLDEVRQFFAPFAEIISGSGIGDSLDLVVSGTTPELCMMNLGLRGQDVSPVVAQAVNLGALQLEHVWQLVRETPCTGPSEHPAPAAPSVLHAMRDALDAFAASRQLPRLAAAASGSDDTDTSGSDPQLQRLVEIAAQLSGGHPRLLVTILRCMLGQGIDARSPIGCDAGGDGDARFGATVLPGSLGPRDSLLYGALDASPIHDVVQVLAAAHWHFLTTACFREASIPLFRDLQLASAGAVILKLAQAGAVVPRDAVVMVRHHGRTFRFPLQALAFMLNCTVHAPPAPLSAGPAVVSAAELAAPAAASPSPAAAAASAAEATATTGPGAASCSSATTGSKPVTGIVLHMPPLLRAAAVHALQEHCPGMAARNMIELLQAVASKSNTALGALVEHIGICMLRGRAEDWIAARRVADAGTALAAATGAASGTAAGAAAGGAADVANSLLSVIPGIDRTGLGQSSMWGGALPVPERLQFRFLPKFTKKAEQFLACDFAAHDTLQKATNPSAFPEIVQRAAREGWHAAEPGPESASPDFFMFQTTGLHRVHKAVVGVAFTIRRDIFKDNYLQEEVNKLNALHPLTIRKPGHRAGKWHVTLIVCPLREDGKVLRGQTINKSTTNVRAGDAPPKYLQLGQVDEVYIMTEMDVAELFGGGDLVSLLRQLADKDSESE